MNKQKIIARATFDLIETLDISIVGEYETEEQERLAVDITLRQINNAIKHLSDLSNIIKEVCR